jgi:hypothetical protein
MGGCAGVGAKLSRISEKVRVKSLRYPLDKKLGGPQSQLDDVEKSRCIYGIYASLSQQIITNFFPSPEQLHARL